mmetsp:Transcript_71753/g.191441  ORF Transcript_71753/g.191441 Transcript_71753/m.191441 type:complete len:201 (+) Transcript_71753:747-1349(+)
MLKQHALHRDQVVLEGQHHAHGDSRDPIAHAHPLAAYLAQVRRAARAVGRRGFQQLGAAGQGWGLGPGKLDLRRLKAQAGPNHFPEGLNVFQLRGSNLCSSHREPIRDRCVAEDHGGFYVGPNSVAEYPRVARIAKAKTIHRGTATINTRYIAASAESRGRCNATPDGTSDLNCPRRQALHKLAFSSYANKQTITIINQG